jgi:carbon monoxide dehydrogenase subunit G
MKMNGEKGLPVTQQVAWEALNDLSLLQSCIPGCESIEAKPDGSFNVRMTVVVGPVKVNFKGEMRMKDVVAPASYTLEFSGNGGAIGYGQGEAQMSLVVVGEHQTQLRYSAIASVGGKLAQVGSRLIDIASQKLAADFFDKFLVELNKRHPQAVTAVVTAPKSPQPSGFWVVPVNWIKGRIGRFKRSIEN